MAWPRPILTDSGGFQVFSLDTLRKVTDAGVLFRSHLNGDSHLFTPRSTVDVQLALGSDIIMVLDECLAYPATHKAAAESTKRTVAWAACRIRTLPADEKRAGTAPCSRSCKALCSRIYARAARMNSWSWTQAAMPSADSPSVSLVN